MSKELNRPSVSPAVLKAVEAAWADQAKNLPGPHSPVYRKAEATFFSGAIAAFEAQGMSLNTSWVLKILSSQNVVSA